MASSMCARRLPVAILVLLAWMLLMGTSAVDAQTAATATRDHNHKLHRIHGWLMGLGWGFFIPAAIVVASFRTLTKLGSSWWFYVHISLASLGYLATLAGVSVACYFPADETLQHQHKIIGIVVTVFAGLQLALRSPQCCDVWNLTHWTLGRLVLALAIANLFIGCYLSNVAHSHIIALAVVLGGLFIIYILKNDIEYMLIKHTPAEEERLLAGVTRPGRDKNGVQMAQAVKDSKARNGYTNGASSSDTNGASNFDTNGSDGMTTLA